MGFGVEPSEDKRGNFMDWVLFLFCCVILRIRLGSLIESLFSFLFYTANLCYIQWPWPQVFRHLKKQVTKHEN